MRRTCEGALRFLDSYVRHGRQPSSEDEVLKHFEDCPDCSQEVELRTRITGLLKQAVHSEPESPHLEAKIRRSIRDFESPGGTAWHWGRRLVAVASVLAVCLGASIAYQLGHLRVTTASQEAYIGSISGKIAAIMRVGLGDHVHCTVFRKFPQVPPSVAEMAAQLGPEYGGLVSLVRQQVPSEYRVTMGHRCSYHGRGFVHLALQSDSGLISLVITRKSERESFQGDRLRPVLSESGISIYEGGVQRFAIAGFETSEHLAYLVSDLSETQNLKMLAHLAAPVRMFLSTLEG